MNGVLIFFLEMPLVSFIERNKINRVKVVSVGTLLMAISLFTLLINSWAGILIIMMLFMTVAEMFTFPFSNSFAISRAPKGHEGRYMAIFTMSFGMAHILSAKIGMEIVGHFGYLANWGFMGVLGLIGAGLGFWVIKLVAEENSIDR
jgi:predicted MFS family arabinose efflux permease